MSHPTFETIGKLKRMTPAPVSWCKVLASKSKFDIYIKLRGIWFARVFHQRQGWACKSRHSSWLPAGTLSWVSYHVKIRLKDGYCFYYKVSLYLYQIGILYYCRRSYILFYQRSKCTGLWKGRLSCPLGFFFCGYLKKKGRTAVFSDNFNRMYYFRLVNITLLVSKIIVRECLWQ